MEQENGCEDKVETEELADLEPATADAKETKAGTPTFHAFDNAFRGGVFVAAGDLE